MAIMDIVLYPDDPLTLHAEPLDRIDSSTLDLAHDMLETMITYDGVGLAGPQVGLNKQIFVLCEPGERPMCFINPEILKREGSVDGEEGCLSLPEIYASIPRAEHVLVKAYSEEGKAFSLEAHDFLARIIQHEYDHLEGKIFPDRLDILSRESLMHDWQEKRQQLAEAVKQHRRNA